MISPVIRANGKMLTRSSTAVRVNATSRLPGIESIDWGDEVSFELIDALNNGAPPLGIAIGRYKCSASISVYADEAYNFEALALGEGLDPTSINEPVRNLTDGPDGGFTITISMREENRTRFVFWQECVIVGRPERAISEDGRAIVLKYDVQPRLIVEDGRTLVNVRQPGLAAGGFGGTIDPESPEHNYVIVNGIKSPGRAHLTGVERPYKWEIIPGYGLSGAFTRFRGPDIAKPLLTLTLWKLEHFIGWGAFKQKIKPPTPEAPFFVEMQHPLLSSADIKAVGVENIGEPTRAPGAAVWTVPIKLIEYRPPVPVTVKPKGSVPAVEKGKPQRPLTEAERELAKWNNRFEASRFAARGVAGPPPPPVPEE